MHSAADAHRKAIAAAVERAIALAKTAQVNPDRDALARTFEALSIASDPPEPLGRLTQPLKPGGFELLAGVEPVARPSTAGTHTKGAADTPVSRGTPTRGVPDTNREGVPHTSRVGDGLETVPAKTSKATIDAQRAVAERAAAERERERAEAAAARRHEAAIAKLEREVVRARQHAAQARLAWDRATDEVSAAERRLSEARRPRPVV